MLAALPCSRSTADKVQGPTIDDFEALDSGTRACTLSGPEIPGVPVGVQRRRRVLRQLALVLLHRGHRQRCHEVVALTPLRQPLQQILHLPSLHDHDQRPGGRHAMLSVMATAAACKD